MMLSSECVPDINRLTERTLAWMRGEFDGDYVMYVAMKDVYLTTITNHSVTGNINVRHIRNVPKPVGALHGCAKFYRICKEVLPRRRCMMNTVTRSDELDSNGVSREEVVTISLRFTAVKECMADYVNTRVHGFTRGTHVGTILRWRPISTEKAKICVVF